MGPNEVSRRLRQWPRGLALDQRTLVRRMLKACGTLFGGSRAVLAWEEPEEPWLIVASLSEDSLTWQEEEPERYLPLVDPALTDSVFHVSGKKVRAGFEKAHVITSAIHEQLREAYGMNEVLSIPVRGEAVQGRIFIIEPSRVTEQTLMMADIVGLLVERSMDYGVSIRTTSRDAVQEERVRVARDLHDGLLQSFTGVVLQLETIHAMVESNPNDARKMITDIEGAIMADQRELRAYVEQLRPRRRIDVPFDFHARMDELRSRFETQWGIGVAFEIGNVDPLVATSLGPETFRIIQEAVTNSAKHGAASHIRVRLSTANSKMRIEVVDDGNGFPFHGRMTLNAIRESGIGPAMLAERVAALNGELSVESSGAGAKLEIFVPLGFVGAP
jgi:signal transduction histidine kinase